MAATRSDHFAGELHLPDASAAVFFLAGVYLRPMWMLSALLVEAAFIDYLAIAVGGVSSFCISPAYGFLLPAYGALWLAGRWYAVRHRFAFSTLLPLAASVVIGGVVSELFSSGGFITTSPGARDRRTNSRDRHPRGHRNDGRWDRPQSGDRVTRVLLGVGW
jgi:hypothetical protein